MKGILNVNQKKPVCFIILAALGVTILGAGIYFLVQSDEISILKKSIPNIVQFYNLYSDELDSLVTIVCRKDHSKAEGNWCVYRKPEGSLRVIGSQTGDWNSITLFDKNEREIIETAFATSHNDIEIQSFDSDGHLEMKSLNRHYIKIMFLPDEKLRKYWIQDDSLVKYSEPIADGWYALIVDGRPSIA